MPGHRSHACCHQYRTSVMCLIPGSLLGHSFHPDERGGGLSRAVSGWFAWRGTAQDRLEARLRDESLRRMVGPSNSVRGALLLRRRVGIRPTTTFKPGPEHAQGHIAFLALGPNQPICLAQGHRLLKDRDKATFRDFNLGEIVGCQTALNQDPLLECSSVPGLNPRLRERRPSRRPDLRARCGVRECSARRHWRGRRRRATGTE